ncbi:hypothetical protein [Streptomyces zagrosensis]|uniref:Uncharacterized protein n=1 Tax=Streptomyces zagrosensis TaxID=1042984 RepID=A0A7W9Q9A5_9ACTN|nr:hypothetical protein [Streptomyces zagrosensis]MBB5935916.1 hypothetical protein [Streptomyces zagrosensis]
MFHYELHQLRQDELIHEATADRRAREATRGRATARRSGGGEAEGRVSPPKGRRAARPRRATA